MESRQSPSNKDVPKAAVSNRRARHDYHILETYEAGIALQGAEVKSLRDGKASLQESFARVEKGEVFLHQCHINPYGYARADTLDPLRKRKLLLHRNEIRRLEGRVQERGLTLVPLEIFFSPKGIAKVSLALAKGKLDPDKRQDLKRRAAEREVRREVSGRHRIR